MTIAEQLIAKGFQQGLEQGMQEGAARFFIQILHQRFGAPSPHHASAIRKADMQTLLSWVGRIWDAESLDDIFACYD